MKKIFYIIPLLLVMLLATSCEDEQLKNAEGVVETPVYHIYNPDMAENLCSGVYEMFLYREYDQLAQYATANWLKASTYETQQFVDDSDETNWDFSFYRVYEDGERDFIEVFGAKDRSMQPTGAVDSNGDPTYYRKSLKMTITFADGDVEVNPTVEVFDIFRTIESE